MKRMIVLIGAALLLTSCAAVPMALSAASTLATAANSPTVQVINGKVQLEGKRGLALASNAYQGASALLVPLIDADKLSPATVDRIDVLHHKVAALLAGTDKTLTLAQRTAEIFGMTDELNRIGGQ
jgi:hypothetical protein